MYRMNLVYDSETFSVEGSFAFLAGLNLQDKKDEGKNGNEELQDCDLKSLTRYTVHDSGFILMNCFFYLFLMICF